MSTFDTTSTRICSRSCAKNILSHYTRGYSSSWGQHPIIGSDASNTIVHHNAARREPGPQDSLRKALQLTWICKEGTGQKAGADWGWPVEHGAGQFVAASDVCVLGRLMARWRGVNMHHRTGVGNKFPHRPIPVQRSGLWGGQPQAQPDQIRVARGSGAPE